MTRKHLFVWVFVWLILWCFKLNVRLTFNLFKRLLKVPHIIFFLLSYFPMRYGPYRCCYCSDNNYVLPTPVNTIVWFDNLPIQWLLLETESGFLQWWVCAISSVTPISCSKLNSWGSCSCWVQLGKLWQVDLLHWTIANPSRRRWPLREWGAGEWHCSAAV